MSSRPRAPLRPGDRVGAFVVREEIGFGATSIVYEAEHRTARQRVAIKVLRSMSDMESELRQRFEREMKLSTTLVSMHVPHVYEVGELPSGLPYIVMERLNGATLADWLAVHRTLPVAAVVEIGLQLCAALEALHEHEVVHRDVKPENLLLHQAFDDGYVVKLVDFGICKPLVGDERALTRRGSVVGTPVYMSPEQVQGLDVDVRTDVYSTGVVLYELLAGRTPFEGRDLDLLSRAILFGSPPRVATLRDDVSALLEAIVMRALARDRADRHPTIGALKRELERFRDEQRLARHPRVWSLMPSSSVARPLLPPPPEGLVRRAHPTLITPRIPIRRAWVVGTAAAALAVLIGAGLSVAYTMYDPLGAEPARAEPEEPAPSPREAEAPPDPAEAAPAPASVEVAPPSAEPALVAPQPARTDPPRLRRRARRPRPPPPSTTVSFAPAVVPPIAPTTANLFAPIIATASIDEPAPVEPPAPPIVEAPVAPAAPRAPIEEPARAPSPIPPSPYDDRAGELPENPF